MKRAQPVHLIDCTLREGMQAPGVHFTPEQSAEIAAGLAAAGVDMIECGHPASSQNERDRIQATLDAAGDTPVLVHARAVPKDVEAAIQTGAAWVGLFIGVNDMSRRTRCQFSYPELVRRICEAIGLAVDHGLSVRFTLEDSSRTHPDLLARTYAIAVEAGARRIGYADTVGTLEPADVAHHAAWLKQRFPDTQVELHLHDDRGLALANALAGLDQGVDWLSCSVNGLGERCGVVDLGVLAANLHHRGTRPLRGMAALKRLSALVSAFSRRPVDASRPVFGDCAFTHTARLHQRAVSIDPLAYSWIPPEVLGAETRLDRSESWSLHDLVIEPEIRSATELRHHRHGPGDRYLLLDERKLQGCKQYVIVRDIPDDDDPGPGHVDTHRHTVDSVFVFLGRGAGLSGLEVEVSVNGESAEIESPATVFIPAGVPHSYRVRRGSGLYLNIVNTGSYERGLLD